MSRASVVAMLIAVEVTIVGIALYALRGSASVRDADFVAKTVAPIDAGASPRIAIDDVDSGVYVTASTDGLVHVKDLTNIHSFLGGGEHVAQVDVKRTFDGVSISRPKSDGMHFVMFGSSERRIAVEVPRGSHIVVTRCSGAHVTGMTGDVAVTSQDGRITLTDVSANVNAKSDDGSIYATRVRGDNILLQSADGRIVLDDVTASSIDAQTKDGRIEARGLAITGGAQRAVLHTGDGSIRVALAAGSDLTVDASTSDGSIEVDGNDVGSSGDSAQHTIRLGNGSGSLQLSSGDGSIHIVTNGAV